MIKILFLFFSTIIMAHTQQDLLKIYKQKGENYQPRTKHLKNGKAQFVNHLILANSPYLLQHAHNPINWHSFNEEALKLAKEQNKMIFLSIGYATCHWCHVMEEESFEDLKVAKILNDNFIAIKVDREILPDVDSHFMNLSQLLTGSGGWPLNVILTPQADGFYAGTYFPQAKLINTLGYLQNLWETDKNRIFQQVKIIKNSLKNNLLAATKLPQNLQSLATANLQQNFDEFYGGFGNTPKFPHESSLLMLIDEQIRNPTNDKLEAITTTLDTMASGGIYDVVGGGFHRYSVDEKWLIPHFEKMLYNQAQLTIVYAKAYQLTGKYLYKRIVKQILNYILKEMKNNGFYSATDADSDGEEGLFFVWKIAEIKNILGEDFKDFKNYFDLSNFSDFETYKIIRYKNINNIQKNEFIKIDKMLAKLYQVRELRNKPLLDNKILLSWNALLLKSFVIAAQIVDKKYLLEAIQLADFLTQTFYQNDNLTRVNINKKTSQLAIFEDYAYFADALIVLFDVTNNKKYLTLAQKLVDEALIKFWDNEIFAFNISNNKLIKIKQFEIYDGALASSNGVIYGVLNKLADRVQIDKYRKFAKQLITGFSAKIIKNPSSYSTIVKNHNDKNYGKLAQVIYAYNGKIKLTVNFDNLLINLADGWHINASKTTQGLVATALISNKIKNIIYPKGVLINSRFSAEKLAIYKNQVKIIWTNKNNDLKLGEIIMQACSDKVCLPPQTIKLLLTIK